MRRGLKTATLRHTHNSALKSQMAHKATVRLHTQNTICTASITRGQ